MRVVSNILFVNEVRLTQDNDWVIVSLVGCAFLYLFMMSSLQRGSSIREYTLSDFYGSNNRFASWIIVSSVFCIVTSLLFSQYIPIVPKWVSEIHVLGYQLNKFGFMLVGLLLFYLLKVSLGYLFFQSTGNSQLWEKFYFVASKFYFLVSLFLMGLVILHYYFPIDKQLFFSVYTILFGLLSIGKLLYYLLNKHQVLPEQWYYKILYICALQIAPLIVLWKLLFF